MHRSCYDLPAIFAGDCRRQRMRPSIDWQRQASVSLLHRERPISTCSARPWPTSWLPMAGRMTANGDFRPRGQAERSPQWLRKWYKTGRQCSILMRSAPGGRSEVGRTPSTFAVPRAGISRQQWHSSCASDGFGSALRTDYVRPQAHTVIFSVNDPPAGTCRWQAGAADLHQRPVGARRRDRDALQRAGRSTHSL